MATVNIGNIKFNWKGPWSNSTTYAVDDVVSLSGSSYISIQAGSNQNPASASAYWQQMSSAGTNGTDGTDVGATLNNKEIAFKTNAGAVDGIPIGTAGQVLKVNSGATGYEYGSAGGLLKSDYSTYSTQVTHNHSSWTNVSNDVSFTPTSSSSDIIIQYSTLVYVNGGVGIAFRVEVDGSELGTNMWASNQPMSKYSGTGTDYATLTFFTKYDNTNTNAKSFKVQARRYDGATNAYSQYNARPSQMLIMEIGV